MFRYNKWICSVPSTLATLYVLITCLLWMLVIMRLLFHVDKYDDDDKLIGLCVKDQVHQCTIIALLKDLLIQSFTCLSHEYMKKINISKFFSHNKIVCYWQVFPSCFRLLGDG